MSVGNMPVSIVTLALLLLGQLLAQAQPGATNKTQALKRQDERARLGRDPEVERVKKQGQLESFSMEATGLGDLEEADAVRIMMRRARDHQSTKGDILKRQQQPPYAAASAARAESGGVGAPSSRPAATDRYYERFLRSLLKRRAAMPPREEENEEEEADGSVEILPTSDRAVYREESAQPIAVTRRTAEKLINTANQVGEQLDDKSWPGEFGSRISLLTTRKIQPEELLMSPARNRAALAILPNYYELLTGERPLDGARAPLEIRNELLALLGATANDRTTGPGRSTSLDYAGNGAPPGEGRPILVGTDSNHLTRVARGFFM